MARGSGPEEGPMWMRVVSQWVVLILILLMVFMASRSCSNAHDAKVDAIKMLVEATSVYSEAVNIRIEMGTWGDNVTIEIEDIDANYIRSGGLDGHIED